jgi:hypothetical protein
MASYCFFIHMHVKEFKQKIYLIKLKVLSFDLGPQKVSRDEFDMC